MEVPFSFLQESNLQLFEADFYPTFEVVGQSIHFREVYVKTASLSESVESSSSLAFKLSKQFIQGCMVNVGLRGCLVRVELIGSIWEDYELNF